MGGITDGKKFVSRYLGDPEIDLEDLVSDFQGKQLSWVREGVREALLSNLTLPSDEFALNRSRRAGEGFAALSDNARKLKMLLSQLEQFFQEYLGERNRMREEVDRAYEPRRQQRKK